MTDAGPFARVAAASGALALTLLFALHVLRPDLEPTSSVISQYALGDYGGILLMWFLTLAVGSAALLLALVRRVETIPAKIGLGFLAIATVGLIMGGVFPMDPVGTPPEQASQSGNLHNAAGMFGITGLVLATLFLGLSLRKRAPWTPVRGWLTALTHFIWIGDVAMIAAMASMFSQPQPAEAANFMGVGNRVLMIAFSGWLIAVAWPLTGWSADRHRQM
ncbi:MAG TPA: DUF998 domain-containing protein [Sphingomicrobium sp.]